MVARTYKPTRVYIFFCSLFFLGNRVFFGRIISPLLMHFKRASASFIAGSFLERLRLGLAFGGRSENLY
jgi:hypothetical protein